MADMYANSAIKHTVQPKLMKVHVYSKNICMRATNAYMALMLARA
jgi:hypothetical protein